MIKDLVRQQYNYTQIQQLDPGAGVSLELAILLTLRTTSLWTWSLANFEK